MGCKQTNKKKRLQELFSSHGWIMGRSSSHRSRSGVHCSPSHSSCFHGRKWLFQHSFLYLHHLARRHSSNWNSRENGHVQEEGLNRLIIVFKLQIRGVWYIYIYIFLPIFYIMALSKRLISDILISTDTDIYKRRSQKLVLTKSLFWSALSARLFWQYPLQLPSN